VRPCPSSCSRLFPIALLRFQYHFVSAPPHTCRSSYHVFEGEGYHVFEGEGYHVFEGEGYRGVGDVQCTVSRSARGSWIRACTSMPFHACIHMVK
jgi:hypothetical protein